MGYQHRIQAADGTLTASPLPLGKVVCVGRNYAAHARELDNTVPIEPLLFMKPATALIPLEEPFAIPADQGVCHVETEMALLIGSRLTQVAAGPEGEKQALSAIAGVGIAFDLTLRDVQALLKQQGYPWEKAKAFDGSCPQSVFVSPDGWAWDAVRLQLWRNGTLQQDGNSADMITSVAALLAYISQTFTLMPGDVVLTGTPAGVGPLMSGDRLEVNLGGRLRVSTAVR
jgi:2-keto-4-pentenoate hydratase/2-oxohepta-3-ene-1,7-dioic acid hydratase in catechol pathway